MSFNQQLPGSGSLDGHAGRTLGPKRTGGKSACVKGMSSWPRPLQPSSLCRRRLFSPGACAFSCWPLYLLSAVQLLLGLPLWMRMLRRESLTLQVVQHSLWCCLDLFAHGIIVRATS